MRFKKRERDRVRFKERERERERERESRYAECRGATSAMQYVKII